MPPGIVEDIVDAIYDAVVKPVTDFITGIINTLWGWISSAINGIIGQITNWVATNILDPLLSFFGEVAGYFGEVWTKFGEIGASISNVLTSLWNQAADYFYTLKGSITDAFTGITEYLYGAFDTVSAWIGDIGTRLETWGSNIITGISEGITGAITTISENLSAVGATITDTVGGWLADIRGGLTNIWNTIAGIPEAFGNALRGAWGALLEGFAAIGEWIVGALMGIGQWIMEHIIDPLIEGVTGIWAQVQEFFRSLMESIWTSITEFFKGHSPIKPEDAPGVCVGAFGLTFMAGLGAHLLARGMEIVQPLKEMGFGQISGFVADMGNFSYVARASLGNIYWAAMYQPMRYWASNEFRPMIPDQMGLRELAVKGDIPIEEFRKNMGYLGFSDEWIDRIETTMYREPRHFELMFMVEDTYVTLDWLHLKLKRAAYTYEDAKRFVIGVVKRAMRDDRRRFLTAVMKHMREGFMTLDEFMLAIDRLDFKEEGGGYCVVDPETGEFIKFDMDKEHRELLRIAAHLEYLYDYYMDIMKLYREEFRKETITEEEFKIGLTTLGLPDKRIDAIVRYEKIRKLPKPKIPVPKEQEGKIEPLQRMYIRLYSLQYRKYLITKEQLYSNLLAIGLSETVAGLIADIEETRRYKVPAE